MPCSRSERGASERAKTAWSRCRPGPLRDGAGTRGPMTRTAVVTGGSGGIGSQVVKQLRESDWSVVSLSRREGCDVSDEAQVKRAFSDMSSLDALIHCAAVLITKPFIDMAADDWDVQIASNLRGAFLCSREAFRLMREGGGSIVFVSSLSGVAGA